MTTRDKVAHILRRFGLGASRSELDFYEKLGVDGTLDRLINWEKVDEGFPIPCAAFAQMQNEVLRLQPQQVTAWWVLRMVASQRPLQEKLTLFWHDHFAISASKVSQGPALLQYLETLRRNANGNFFTMLREVSKDPAMILWLDNNTNVRGKPNENFAREVLELFTLGIGNYTETDIKEAARAFTGWNIARTTSGRPTNEEITNALKENRGLLAFQFRPALHDTGQKSVLGNQGNWNGDDVLGMLVGRPETAKYITGKLWSFFASEKVPPKVQEKLSRLYLDKGMEIKPILFAIGESDEFYSDSVVRKQVKSPIDFVVGLARLLGIGTLAVSQYKPEAENAGRAMGGSLRAITLSMTNQGLTPLYPPDVAGWDWGGHWISSATMVERIKFASTLFGGRNANPAAQWLLQSIKSTDPKTSKDVVTRLLDIYDSKLSEDKIRSVVAALDELGGVSALSTGQKAQAAFLAMSKLIFAAPDFQFC